MPCLYVDACSCAEVFKAAVCEPVVTHVLFTLWFDTHTVCRDGISLKTLYRQAAGHKASLLVIRDRQQHVFGFFASETWRVAPRYAACLCLKLPLYERVCDETWLPQGTTSCFAGRGLLYYAMLLLAAPRLVAAWNVHV